MEIEGERKRERELERGREIWRERGREMEIEGEGEGEREKGLELCEKIQRGSRGNREKTGGTVNNLASGSLVKV